MLDHLRVVEAWSWHGCVLDLCLLAVGYLGHEDRVISSGIELLIINGLLWLIFAWAGDLSGHILVFCTVHWVPQVALLFARSKVVLGGNWLVSVLLRVVKSWANLIEAETGVGIRCHFLTGDTGWYWLWDN